MDESKNSADEKQRGLPEDIEGKVNIFGCLLTILLSIVTLGLFPLVMWIWNALSGPSSSTTSPKIPVGNHNGNILPGDHTKKREVSPIDEAAFSGPIEKSSLIEAQKEGREKATSDNKKSGARDGKANISKSPESSQYVITKFLIFVEVILSISYVFFLGPKPPWQNAFFIFLVFLGFIGFLLLIAAIETLVYRPNVNTNEQAAGKTIQGLKDNFSQSETEN